jgi:hypothetical protein
MTFRRRNRGHWNLETVPWGPFNFGGKNILSIRGS